MKPIEEKSNVGESPESMKIEAKLKWNENGEIEIEEENGEEGTGIEMKMFGIEEMPKEINHMKEIRKTMKWRKSIFCIFPTRKPSPTTKKKEIEEMKVIIEEKKKMKFSA